MSNLMQLLHNLLVAIKAGQLPQLGYWTYILLAFLVALEGPLATLLAAAAASVGLMRPLLVFIAAATGNLIADILWYSLGYMGKIEWLHRFGRWMGLRQSLIDHLKKNLLEHAIKVLFLAKLTLTFVIPSLIAAGLLRIPWKRWLPALILAETLWTGSLVLIGYYATESLKRVEQRIEYIALAISILFVLAVLFAGRRLIKQWDKDNPEPSSKV